MKTKFLSLLLFISIFGCFGSPVKMAMVSDDDLKYVATMELCTAYGDKLFRTDRIKNELIARLALHRKLPENTTAVFRDESGKIAVISHKQPPPEPWEWDLIAKGEIKKGMTQCGLLASWGRPAQIVKKSRRVDEWIYHRFFGQGLVYVREGKIKSWEE